MSPNSQILRRPQDDTDGGSRPRDDSVLWGLSSYVCITKKIPPAVMSRPLSCTPFFGQKSGELKVFSKVRR